MTKMWSTVTVAGVSNGTNLKIFLRRGIKMLKENKTPYSPELRVQAQAEEIGLCLDPQIIWKDIDLTLDSEKIIKQILKENY